MALLMAALGVAVIIKGIYYDRQNYELNIQAKKESEKVREAINTLSVDTIEDNIAQYTVPEKTVEGIAYIGIIRIDTLNLELPVASVLTDSNLQKAPCRYYGDTYDDLIIAAHNYDAHFGRIKNLTEGDSVIFTDVNGRAFKYKVEELEELGPFQSKEMINNNEGLTLFTCTPGGKARVVVRCRYCEDRIPDPDADKMG